MTEPKVDTVVYMHSWQLYLCVKTGRIESYVEGQPVTTLKQRVVVDDGLPREGVFFEDNECVVKVLRRREEQQRRRAQLEEYKGRWSNQ